MGAAASILTRYRRYFNISGMLRLTRPEQSAQNRQRVLDVAGKLFRRNGFHGATLEQIADRAGFSKGVIYSQFGSKDDLFLALMEQRMDWRIGQALELVRNAPAETALRMFVEQARGVQEADVPWMLLSLEFRIHAARTPDLNRRYAALHRRTLDGLAQIFSLLASKAGIKLRYEAVDFARLVAALDSGAVLEGLVEGPGSAFEVAHHAVWLVLRESATGPSKR